MRVSNRLIESVGHYMASVMEDPILFVQTAFEHEAGFEFMSWQREVLQEVQSGLLSPSQAVRVAVSSGHGIGKSALVSWLILWSLCKPYTRGIVTANTASQLSTKTWAELSKWFQKSVLRSVFTLTATSIYSSMEGYDKTWRVDAITWSEHRTEAFAGLHNQGNRILILFDEGSAIPDTIYEVVEGALTDEDTEKIFAIFGNPTRPVGRFREIFGRLRSKWLTYTVDSRTVRLTNKDLIGEWERQYGEDSDFFRVRVRGLFPKTSNESLIGEGKVSEAMGRFIDVNSYNFMPRVMGVDVARFGDDDSAICRRQGRKAFPILTYKELDTMQLAGEVVKLIESFQPHKVFIDETGVGAGVVDRLKELGYRDRVVGVNFGSKALDTLRYSNKRAEMWGLMNEWLETGCLEYDEELKLDLVAPTYSFNSQGQLVLESKKDMKKRGLASPDSGDALALTFAEPVRTRIESINVELR